VIETAHAQNVGVNACALRKMYVFLRVRWLLKLSDVMKIGTGGQFFVKAPTVRFLESPFSGSRVVIWVLSSGLFHRVVR
jgi:hypothetical protein